MDNTPEEMQTQLLIASRLIREGILIAEPYFDQLGGDLLGFTAAGEKAAICRIQCKFRNCLNRNYVLIPEQYVEGAFVLFLNLRTNKGDHLVCLLPEEIEEYAKVGKDKNKSVYRFTLTEDSAQTMIADIALVFNAQKADKIKVLMQESSSASRMYKDFLKISTKAKELLQLHERMSNLQAIKHKIEIANVNKKAAEAQIKMLNDVLNVLEDESEGRKEPAG